MTDTAALTNLFGLDGKTALVTGGSRGIGYMATKGLVDAGARVYIVARKAHQVEDAVQRLGVEDQVVGLTADLSSAEACREFAAQLAEREDSLDILVNNAGASWGEPFGAFSPDGWDKVFDINVKAPYFLTEALVPLLEKNATRDDPSRVIMVGSIDGLGVPIHTSWPYGPSKAAVHHMTRVLAREVGPKFITVNAIAPGPFESQMMAHTLETQGDEIAQSSVLGRIGRPDDIAGTVLFLSGRSGAYLTGTVIPVDGGIVTTR